MVNVAGGDSGKANKFKAKVGRCRFNLKTHVESD